MLPVTGRRPNRVLGVSTRYRCSACGNLTRFDVTVTRTQREYQHFSVGGDVAIDEVELIDERVDSVACRWCGPGAEVEEL